MRVLEALKIRVHGLKDIVEVQMGAQLGIYLHVTKLCHDEANLTIGFSSCSQDVGTL
jgi:hypothetical protein